MSDIIPAFIKKDGEKIEKIILVDDHHTLKTNVAINYYKSNDKTEIHDEVNVELAKFIKEKLFSPQSDEDLIKKIVNLLNKPSDTKPFDKKYYRRWRKEIEGIRV